ncbi:SnoaL-like domain-containing protein [Thermoleophilia bacterium SCSIO 60948]|nr:SnoaL-like domain-containing protein [Thermoleophilia bacterium SCSIO 60948]
MERGDLERWIEAYERLWRMPGTDGLADLFAADATYSAGPYTETVRGFVAIQDFWEAERDSHEERFEFSYEVIAVEGSVGVAKIDVRYLEPAQDYLDIWIVEFDGQGLCTRFEEWPYWPDKDPDSAGSQR